MEFQSSQHNMLPDPMQKESAQPITLLGENVQNVPKYWDFLGLPKSAKSDHILDVFSGQGDQIELIPFALSQTYSSH